MRINGVMVAAVIAGFALSPLDASAASKGTSLDVRKPAAEQIKDIRAELGDGKTYSEISLEDRSKVQVALARMELALGGKAGVDELSAAEQVDVFNDQQVVNGLLTQAREDSRLVCRREKQVGSNMPTNQCMTVAERRRRADSDQRNFQRAQQLPGKPNG